MIKFLLKQVLRIEFGALVVSEMMRRINNPYEWQGENLLGFALTEVREEIKSVYANEGLVDYSLVK